MASIYDKKFKTTDATKAADAEVVSDPIELSPRTKNHVLVVTTDSSLSGTVDVEVEMSPDGTNWCPAVSRTQSVTAGGTTTEIVGNEESVKLTPDAGEFKNKHARGGLNFDVSGSVVTPDGSGARDLMDQHVAINKSFNYSQWFKTSEQPSLASDETVTFAVTVSGGVFNIDGSAQATLNLKEGSTYTFDQSDASNSGHPLKLSATSNGSHGGGSEYTTGVTIVGTPGSAGAYTRIVVAASAPTLYYYCNNHSGMGGTANTPVNIDYKPVLFRHGGHDTFENTKVIETSAGTATENLVESKSTFSTTLNGTKPQYEGASDLDILVGSDAATFFGTSGSVNTAVSSIYNLGKYQHSKFKPDVDFSTSRWIFVKTNNTEQAGWRGLSSFTDGYLNTGLHYIDSGSIRFSNVGGATVEFSQFVSSSVIAGGSRVLEIAPTLGNIVPNQYWYVTDAAPDLIFTHHGTSTTFTANLIDGFNCVTTYDAPTDPENGIPESAVCMYINGNKVEIHTTTESGTDYVKGYAPADNYFKGDETYTHESSTFSDNALQYGTTNRRFSYINNHLDFTRVLTAAEASKLYNGGKLLDFTNLSTNTSFPVSKTNLVRAYDADQHVFKASGAIEGLKDVSGYGLDIIDETRTYSVLTDTVSPSLSYMATPSLKLANVFKTSSNLSISGWFKTTDTGTLFSNTDGAAADGMKLEVNASNMVLTLIDSSQTVTAVADVDDGNWHHVVVVKPIGATPTIKIYVDGEQKVSTTVSTISNDDVGGGNGFTLLGDGQENAHATSPGATDASKLSASISNWSVHSEVLSADAVKQIYSNGHVRNIKNLPSVASASIKAWWQLQDPTTPEQDSSGNTVSLVYVDGSGSPINDKAIQTATNLTSGTADFESNDASLFGGTVMPDYQGAWSLSFWVNIPSNGSSFDTIIGQHDVASTQSHFKIFQLSGKLNFSQAFNGNALDLSVPFTTYNTWKHVVISKAAGEPGASNMAIYIDGVAQTVSTNYNDNSPARGTTNHWGTTNTSRIRVGAQSWSYTSHNNNAGSRTARAFKVDELAGYSKALSSSEASAIYNSGNWHLLTNLASSYYLESYYRFGNGTGDVTSGTINIKDQVVNSKEITVQDSDNQDIITLTSSDAPFKVIGASSLVPKLVTATEEVLAEDVINGNAVTISLTKSFNFTTNKWVETANQDTALCLSFNGFEEQAEYFAIWKCSQTIAGSTIDICDGAWHNVILSYRGNNDLSGSNVSEGDSVLFGPGPADSLAYHWALSFDGQPLTAINDGSGVDYIGGVNTIATASYNATTYNVSFPIYNRHLKYNSGNAEEVYKPHAQFSAGIHEVVGVDNINAFQGYVDETSFHSDCWWVDQAGTSVITNTLNPEKPATVYGNTTALSNRGAGTEYLSGVPYPLNDPAKIGSARGSNQFINPYRKGETQEDAATSIGGLEGWWRWGDTPGDCSITINDVKDHDDSINARDVAAFGIVTADRQVMTSSDSIYNADRAAGTTAGSVGITYPQVKLEGISSAICNIKEILSPLLQFVRVKWKGAGSVDLGEGKGEAMICHTNRLRRRRK